MNEVPKSASTNGFKMPACFTTKHFPSPATKLPCGWLVAEATITPDLAREMLDCRPDVQRNIRPGYINRYVSDMANGFWKFTHQGMAFDINGWLVDGQHRLSSVIESGARIKCLVFFGVGGNNEMAVMDTGASRSATDAGKTLRVNMDNDHAAVIRQLFTPPGRTSMTHSEVINYFEIHRQSVTFACQVARGFTTAVKAAVASAWYHCDHERLVRFIAVVKQEVMPSTEPGDRAAVTLNKYLNDANKQVTRSRDSRRDSMYKAQRAIQAYMQGEDLLVLRPMGTATYPIPTDGAKLF